MVGGGGPKQKTDEITHQVDWEVLLGVNELLSLDVAI